jgi:alcohol dehydrogenase
VKAWGIRRYKDPVELLELRRPEPGPNDLLVKVRAASVNPVDFKIRDGGVKVLIPYKFPLVLGNDLAGDVEAVGVGVTRFKPGDAIYARLDKDRIGAFAEWALVSESACAPKPAGLDYAQAASLPLVGLTAWQALIEIGQLTHGQAVLIHAGSGGVGTFAIQLARHLGATVATTASAKNHELVRSLGADLAIDYKTTRFEEVVHDQDVVFDTQGGETLLRSFQSVKRGGVVVTVGGVPDGKFARAWGVSLPIIWALTFMTRKITAAAKQSGARFEYLFMRPSGDQLAEISKLVDQRALKPVLDRRFPFDATREAVAYVETGKAVGKVIVDVAP